MKFFLDIKKIVLPLQSQTITNWWIRLTVRTEDSQSSNRSSILLSTTKKKLTQKVSFFRIPTLRATAVLFLLFRQMQQSLPTIQKKQELLLKAILLLLSGLLPQLILSDLSGLSDPASLNQAVIYFFGACLFLCNPIRHCNRHGILQKQ